MANLTKKMYLENYHPGEKTTVVEVKNECHLTLIREPEETHETFHNSRIITVPGREYVAGPIIDRLAEFESIGMEPEDIKAVSKELHELIRKRIKKKVVVKKEFKQVVNKLPHEMNGCSNYPSVEEIRYYRCPSCNNVLASRYKITKLYPNGTIGSETDCTRKINYDGMDKCSLCKQSLDWSYVDKETWA